MVGRFAGDNSLAAVGATASLVNLITNLFIGLSIGTNVVAAHYYGAADKKRLAITVHTAMLLSVFSGIALTTLGILFATPILRLMQAPPEVLALSALYLRIYFCGMTATMIYNFGAALLRAKGDTRRPLFILLAAGIINVLLNLVFVIPLKMDVAGVGLATAISQCFSAVMVVVLLLRETDDFRLSLKKLGINREIFIQIVKIGVPAGVQGIIFSFSNIIIQSSVNSFGAMTIAGNSAAMSIEGFVYISMNCFAQGTLTFTSQNMGAERHDRVKKAAFCAELCVLVLGLLLGNLAVLFGKPLLHIYSLNPSVVAAGMSRLRIICTLYCLCGMMDCLANVIRGMGHSFVPMIITLVGVCGFRVIWIFSVFRMERFHSCETIYYSYPISWIVALVFLAISLAVLFRRISKNAQQAL